MTDLDLMQRAWVNALRDPGNRLAMEAALHGWSGGRRSDEVAFSIHVNNVRAAVLSAMSLTYPRTKALVGDKLFAQAMLSMLREEPPVSGDLGDYGESFPVYLSFFGSSSLVTDIAKCEWLIDYLARTPSQACWTLEEAAAVAPETWPDLTLELSRGARAMAFENDVLQALDPSFDPPNAKLFAHIEGPATPHHALILGDSRSPVHAISMQTYVLASILQRPNRFEEATDRSMELVGNFDPFAALLPLISHGAIATPGGRPNR